MTEPDDMELWTRAAAGDADAFGLVFERHGPRIHGFALRRTGDPTTADDVTAVVFLEAWRRRAEVDLERPTLLPWLYGVATNVVRQWRRTQRRHHQALARLAQLPPPSTVLVERQVAAAEEAAAVVEALRGLPRHERVVLELSVAEGLSHAEVAEALGISVGTVKSRLSRARARLDRHRSAPDPYPNPIPIPEARP